MRTPASIAGHPIHPMLVPIPIGLWIFSLTCDLVHAGGSGDPAWATVALYTMGGGIVGALLAALPGLIDLLSLPPGPRKAAIAHMTINLTVVALYAVNLWLRLPALGLALGLRALEDLLPDQGRALEPEREGERVARREGLLQRLVQLLVDARPMRALGLGDDCLDTNAPPCAARKFRFDLLAGGEAEQGGAERREHRDAAPAVGLPGIDQLRMAADAAVGKPHARIHGHYVDRYPVPRDHARLRELAPQRLRLLPQKGKKIQIGLGHGRTMHTGLLEGT